MLRPIVVSMQACWRGPLTRDHVRQVQECQHAAVRIQQFWRCPAWQRQDLLNVQEEYASVMMQAMVQGALVRWQYLALYRAVITIQSFLQMSQQRLQIRMLREIVMSMQVCWQGALVRNQFRRVQECQHAVVCIQRFWREMRSNELSIHVQESAATVIIQAMVRGRLIRWHYLALNRAVITIQSFLRMSQQRLQIRMLREIVMSMQACWRGALVRNQFRRVQECQHAVVCIQRFWRDTTRARELLQAQVESLPRYRSRQWFEGDW
jgi:myosin heavy subunit